jgi:hypothetical protein
MTSTYRIVVGIDGSPAIPAWTRISSVVSRRRSVVGVNG